jgi:hypothetical protein
VFDCWVLSGGLVWPGLAPAGEVLSFASPKESAQRKGEPKSGPLRGSLRCSRRGGNSQTCPLRGLRTCEFLIPTPLRCSARPHGGKRERGQSASQDEVFPSRGTKGPALPAQGAAPPPSRRRKRGGKPRQRRRGVFLSFRLRRATGIAPLQGGDAKRRGGSPIASCSASPASPSAATPARDPPASPVISGPSRCRPPRAHLPASG